jgi:hypothetical protein
MATWEDVIRGAAQQANAAAAMARKTQSDVDAIRQLIQQTVKSQMALNMPGSRAGMKYVDDIPGRRVYFDMVASIPIAADSSGPYEQALYVTPDGYFVATHRYAIFLSSYVFQVTSEGNETATFNGRSNGRYRPIHSACDLLDAQGGWNEPVGVAAPGTGLMQVDSITNRSGFRTMQFDGTVEVVVRDSDYRRQNNPVPTPLWAPGFESILKLPVPDVFRPATTIDISVQANHTNNPAAGNIQNVVGALPYLDGQYDGHEGIGTVAAVQAGTDDAITRRPDGILYVGFLGYRIVAPAGATA